VALNFILYNSLNAISATNMDARSNPIEKNSDLLIDSKKNQGRNKTEVKNKQSR